MTFSWCPISALQILYWLWAGDFSTYPTHNLSHQAQVPLQDGAWIAGCLGTWSLLLPHEYTKWPTDYYNCFGLFCDSTHDLGLCLHLLLHWVVGAAQPGEHFFLLWCLKLVLFVSSKGPVTNGTLEALFGRKCWDWSTSLYTSAWGPQGPRKFELIESLHGVLCCMRWTVFHGLLGFATRLPQGGGFTTKPGDHETSESHNHWFIKRLTWIG